jgi:hypothetical protein
MGKECSINDNANERKSIGILNIITLFKGLWNNNGEMKFMARLDLDHVTHLNNDVTMQWFLFFKNSCCTKSDDQSQAKYG